MDRINQIKTLRDQGKTYREIGEILGISRQRVSQLLPGYLNPAIQRSKRQRRAKGRALLRLWEERKETRRQFLSTPEGMEEIRNKKREMERFKKWRQRVDRKHKYQLSKQEKRPG